MGRRWLAARAGILGVHIPGVHILGVHILVAHTLAVETLEDRMWALVFSSVARLSGITRILTLTIRRPTTARAIMIRLLPQYRIHRLPI